MWYEVGVFFHMALGLGLPTEDIAAWQMALRALVVFSAAILMVRIGHKRFMGKNTTIDVLLGIIMGSVLSRAITGNAPFFPTLAAGLALVCFHWLLTAVSFHWHRFGLLIKGRERCLIENGERCEDAMRKSHITEYDLQEALRNEGWQPDIAAIDTAYLERNGSISVTLKQ